MDLPHPVPVQPLEDEEGVQLLPGDEGMMVGLVDRAGGHGDLSTAQGQLSSSPMPEYWCSILYFELDTQVI